MRASVARLCTTATLFVGAAACTPLESPDDVYDNVTGNVAQELPTAGAPSAGGPRDETAPSTDPWNCVGQLPTPEPSPDDLPETVTYTVPIVDWLTDEAPPGLKISVCNRIDAMCSAPVSVFTPAADRVINFPLPARFEVFLILQATGTVPARFYFDGPVTTDLVGGRIQLLPVPIALSLADSLGINLDLSMGVLSLRSHDCKGAIAPGTRFEIDPNAGVPYVLINGAPTLSALPTDRAGLAGFVNVPAGNFVARGFLAEDSREFGLANFQVLPGWFSLVEVRSTN